MAELLPPKRAAEELRASLFSCVETLIELGDQPLSEVGRRWEWFVLLKKTDASTMFLDFFSWAASIFTCSLRRGPPPDYGDSARQR